MVLKVATWGMFVEPFTFPSRTRRPLLQDQKQALLYE